MAKEVKQGEDNIRDAELLIKVPAGVLYEAFICPICLGELSSSHLTECGHNFCEHCIRECLNRRHVCPLCQRPTTQDKLIKNHSFDSLFQKLKDEKEKASREYIQNLMQQAHSVPKEGLLSSAKSPIEELFQQHTRRFLFAYEDYFRELQSNFDKQRLLLRAECVEKLSEIRSIQNVLKLVQPEEEADEPEGPEAVLPPIDKFALPSLPLARTVSTEQACLAGETLIRTYNETVTEMTTRFNASVAALTASYDSHMQSIAPPVFLIPVKCALVFPALGIKFDVSLRPTNCVGDALTLLTERQRTENNPVVGHKTLKFFLRRPFSSAPGAKGPGEPLNKPGLQEVGGHMTVSELKLEQESELVIEGEILLKSSEPAKCFSMTYVKGEEKKIDYYRCQECALNWICQPCSVSCHVGHKLVPFMMDHKPTYGCCYCPRNKKCVLQAKKSKG